jgi:glycosyltransferase involved in cell wall biosynthesis
MVSKIVGVTRSGSSPEVSVVMPCLNEAKTLTACIEHPDNFPRKQYSGEIIIADNGSNDGSRVIAESMGARVLSVSSRGYGSALMGGISAALGRFVIMRDSDCSYDFRHIPRLLVKLRAGNDLVMGNRFLGGIKPGAMSPPHKYIGNPILTHGVC